MNRIIEFNSGIIEGTIVDEVVEIIPQIKDQFTQRKSFFEYHFQPIKVELTLDQIDRLSDNWGIRISYDTLVILID